MRLESRTGLPSTDHVAHSDVAMHRKPVSPHSTEPIKGPRGSTVPILPEGIGFLQPHFGGFRETGFPGDAKQRFARGIPERSLGIGELN
jgi:hypothetical protein